MDIEGSVDWKRIFLIKIDIELEAGLFLNEYYFSYNPDTLIKKERA